MEHYNNLETSDNKMSLTVKAYFEKSADNIEIRRFSVDTGVSSNFNYLCSKLTQVFGALAGKSFDVCWKDPDGDLVYFSTDEELVDALCYVNDAIFRVYIREKVLPVTPKNEGLAHPGIECDGCNKAVCGTRFKCLECADFDLCAVCESGGAHAVHKMLRLTNPNMPIHDLAGAFGFPPPPPQGGPWNHPPHHMGPHGPRHMGHQAPWAGGPPRGPPFGPWRKWMKRCWRQWMRNMNAPQGQQCQDNPSTSSAPAGGPDVMFCDDTEDKTPKQTPDGAFDFSQQQKSRDQDGAESVTSSEASSIQDEYLKNVGESVAAMLDPLGISVDVDVEHNGARRRCQGGQGQSQGPGQGRGWEQWKPWEAMFRNWGAGRGQTNPWSGCQQQQREEQQRRQEPRASAAPSGEESEKHKSKPQEAPVPTPSAAAAPPDVADVQMGSPRSSESPDEWTFLKKDAQPAAKPAAPQVQPTNPTAPQGIYPLAQEPVHPNLKIREALTQLKAMGFCDDGGWLTSLLESKGGDINKVLDALKPHKG